MKEPSTAASITEDAPRRRRLRFDRHEWAGSFGDIGTDLPLIVGMILAVGLDSASVFIVFGLLQLLTGLVYGLPMPMQPLKAMAVLVITQKIAGPVLFGAGLSIGIAMLLLSVTGALGWLARVIPLCAVRGVQFGLGLSLASLALKTYLPSAGVPGYALAAVGFAILIALWGSHRYPAGLFVIALGIVYAMAFKLDWSAIGSGIGFTLPQVHRPTLRDMGTGFLVLALPQIPLSLSNSIIATRQTIHDLFPARRISVRRIGLTYSVANLLAPLLSGIPVCHGCGGLAGHYALGARTGGSVVIYGSIYLLIGLFLSGAFAEVVQVFPQPILGVVLLFEALTLLLFIRDQAANRRHLFIALLVGLLAFAVPQGYVVGILVGVALYYVSNRFPLLDGADRSGMR